jgi:hypothetical protein
MDPAAGPKKAAAAKALNRATRSPCTNLKNLTNLMSSMDWPHNAHLAQLRMAAETEMFAQRAMTAQHQADPHDGPNSVPDPKPDGALQTAANWTPHVATAREILEIPANRLHGPRTNPSYGPNHALE